MRGYYNTRHHLPQEHTFSFSGTANFFRCFADDFVSKRIRTCWREDWHFGKVGKWDPRRQEVTSPCFIHKKAHHVFLILIRGFIHQSLGNITGQCLDTWELFGMRSDDLFRIRWPLKAHKPVKWRDWVQFHVRLLVLVCEYWFIIVTISLIGHTLFYLGPPSAEEESAVGSSCCNLCVHVGLV